MTKINFQVNNVEAEGGGATGQSQKSEDAKLHKLGVKQQLKVHLY